MVSGCSCSPSMEGLQLKRLRLVLLLLAVCIKPTSSFMGSLLGGSITWRLHPQFETNSVIYFKIRTAFDRTDGLDEGTGISLEVYKPAEGPGLNYGDRFGVLKVETTDLRLRSCSMLQESR